MTLDTYLREFDARDWQTTDEGTVRFALVGLGWWTVEQAVPAIADSAFCEVGAVVSSSPEKAERVATGVDGDTRSLSYDEFRDGAATDAYDAAYVSTPNAFHLDYARAAAEHGKHVLTEKPMEATTERAAEMVDVCEEAGVDLLVGYRMHTEPAVRRARELVREGAIGDPQFVHSANTQRLLDIFGNHDQWRVDPELTGYGTSVMDLGIYSINTARFLLDTDPRTVTAEMDSSHPAFDEVPDEQARFSLTFEDGTYAVCTCSQNAEPGSFLEITGTEGRIRLDPAFHLETTLSVTVDGETATLETTGVDQMREIFDYAANSFLTDRSATPDGRHGLVDMRTIESVHEAAETDGQVVVD